MPAYLSWVNHADTATLSTTTSGTMLRPLSQLQVPWAKGLCRGPVNGSGGTATLVIRCYWANGVGIHHVGIVGLNNASVAATLRMSYTAFGNIDVYTESSQFVPFLSGSTDPLGSAIWFPMPSLTASYTTKYLEISIEAYDLPSGQEHVDVRRLLVMSGGGSVLGFDRGWSIYTEDTSKDTQTPRGGVFIEEEQSSRIIQFAMTGRSSGEMREYVHGFYPHDSLERVLTACGKRKEIVVCPRYYPTYTDRYRNTIYGRLQSWSPIVHDSGSLYSCEQVIAKEIPHPPL